MAGRRFALWILIVSLAVSCSRSRPEPGAEGSPTAPTAPSSPSPAATPSVAPPPSGVPVPTVVLGPDGLGVAKFGDEAEPAIRALTQALGRPDRDTGWGSSFGEYGTCPGEAIRALTWKSLTVLFARGGTPLRSDGKPHILGFEYGGTTAQASAEPKLATAKGISVGSTIEQVKAAYGPGVDVFEDEVTQSTAFRIGDDPRQITGFFSSGSPGARVKMLLGGAVCGE